MYAEYGKHPREALFYAVSASPHFPFEVRLFLIITMIRIMIIDLFGTKEECLSFLCGFTRHLLNNLWY